MRHDLVGKRFGRLVVLEDVGSVKNQRMWRCQCDCGNEKIVPTSYLTSGDTQSCGCLHHDIVSRQMTTHGYTKDHKKERLWGVWCSMKTRVNNPHASNYQYYGARGIKICDAWLDYANFRCWALDNGYDPDAPYGQCTLDRIDPDGDYSPENCRWVNMNVQANNMRSNHLMEYNGEIHNMKEWSNILGINYSTFKKYVNQCGMSIYDMLA